MCLERLDLFPSLYQHGSLVFITDFGFFFFYIHGQDALLKVVTVVYRVQINLDMSV